MKIITLFTLIILSSSFGFAEITIGGIFDNEGNGRNDEKALRTAITLVNQNKQQEEQHLAPAIINVPPRDPFQALLKTCNLFETGALTIFGPDNQQNFDAVQSVCDYKDVPIIQTRWNYRPMRDTIILNFYPHPTVLSQAYIDIIKKWQWKQFVVLYDDDESLLRLSNVIKLSQDNSLKVVTRKLDEFNTGIYRTILKEISKSDLTNIILDCRIDHLTDVLIQAQQIGIMNSQYSFFITNLDLHTVDLSAFQYSEIDITGVQLVNMKDELMERIRKEMCNDTNNNENEIIDECNLDTSSALIIDAMFMLDLALSEIERMPTFEKKELSCDTTSSWDYGSSLVASIKTRQFSGLTGLIKFDNEGFRSDFLLRIIELHEDGLGDIGTWSTSNGLSAKKRNKDDSIEEDTETLQNKTLIVQICLVEPHAYLKESPTNLVGNDRFEGFGIDLIEEIAKVEKFNYNFTLCANNSNGAKNPKTGEWSGMIGDLIKHKADLAIADLTINSERAGAVDFTVPFMNLGICILFQKPGQAPPNFFSFADPFAIDTWISLAIAFVVVSISLYIMGRISPSEWTNPYPCIEEPEFLVNQFSLSNSFWFSTGSLMQQGTEIAPIAISTRMVAGMWWFFVLIIIASYTASLAAFLATENPLKLFTDVNSLVENAEEKGLRFGAKSNGATENFFRDSNVSIYKKVYEHMKENKDDMVEKNAQGVALAEKDTYAFFMESTSIEYETERHCSLEMYGDLLDHKGYGIAMPINSTYRDRLSTTILKLQSSGVIDDLRRKWWQERRGGGVCVTGEDNTEATALNMSNVEGVFYVTILGLGGGIIWALFEKFVDAVKISKQTKSTLKETIKREVKFYFNFESNVKPVGGSNSNSDDEMSKESMSSTNKLKPSPYGFVGMEEK